MDISVVIVNYNQKNFLKLCLKNINEANIKLDYEVIIIDNASIDGSVELLNSQFIDWHKNSHIRIIINKENCGFAKANNQGIKLAQGKYILILNPDVIVTPDSIEKLFYYMEKHPNVGIVGPQLLNPDKSIQYSCCQFPRWYIPILRRTFFGHLPGLRKKLRAYLMEDWDHQQIQTVDWLLGAALMIRKEIFNQVGLFDEKFFLYFEDIDLARRVRQAGYQICYFPKAKMYHFHQRLSAEHPGFPALFSKITWIHIASAIKYFWKWRKISA